MRLDPQFFHQRLAELLSQRKRFVVATIIDVKGSCPQKPGAKMIVHPDGSGEFTIGGGTFEAEVLRDGLSLMHSEFPEQRQYRLTKPHLGMYCQGLVTVLLEPYKPRPRLLIFGGGHVGQALSRIAGAAKVFELSVIDDRQEYATVERHPDADSVIYTDRQFLRDVPTVDDQTYIVIVTRCHATDKLLVKRYLQQPSAYIGVIGSKSKVRQFRKELMEEGIPENSLKKLHAPIGIPLGGKDPAEVALSILAELVLVKNSLPVAAQARLQVKK